MNYGNAQLEARRIGNQNNSDILIYCLSNALHSSIGQNIKSLAVSDIRSPVSVLRSEREKLQMAITQQRVIRSTSCLVLGWVFSKGRLALFNLTAHELHELYYDRPTSERGIGQTPWSFEHCILYNI